MLPGENTSVFLYNQWKLLYFSTASVSHSLIPQCLCKPSLSLVKEVISNVDGNSHTAANKTTEVLAILQGFPRV